MTNDRGFDYERSDVENSLVAWLAGGLATFVALTPLVLPLIFPQALQRVTPAGRPALTSNAPPLEVSPARDLQKLKEDEADRAGSYGWIDRDHGVVRIPIARAKEMLVRRRLPGWPSP